MVKKGMHEKQMELAGDMLGKHLGMSEIVKETGLSEADVLKKQRKMQQKLED